MGQWSGRVTSKGLEGRMGDGAQPRMAGDSTPQTRALASAHPVKGPHQRCQEQRILDCLKLSKRKGLSQVQGGDRAWQTGYASPIQLASPGPGVEITGTQGPQRAGTLVPKAVTCWGSAWEGLLSHSEAAAKTGPPTGGS